MQIAPPREIKLAKNQFEIWQKWIEREAQAAEDRASLKNNQLMLQLKGLELK